MSWRPSLKGASQGLEGRSLPPTPPPHQQCRTALPSQVQQHGPAVVFEQMHVASSSTRHSLTQLAPLFSSPAP